MVWTLRAKWSCALGVALFLAFQASRPLCGEKVVLPAFGQNQQNTFSLESAEKCVGPS